MSQPIHTYIELSGLRLEVIGTYYKGEDACMAAAGWDAQEDARVPYFHGSASRALAA